jgi:hypothetical protein
MEAEYSKISSEYLFYANWTDSQGTKQPVAVKLIISHRNKSFNIVPESSSNEKFGFIGGGKNTSIMWYAIAEAICKATTFARKELGFEDAETETDNNNKQQ